MIFIKSDSILLFSANLDILLLAIIANMPILYQFLYE